MATKKQLEKKMAYLEFVQDQLETELTYINQLLKSVGFPQGLDSAKMVALELLETENNADKESENHEV